MIYPLNYVDDHPAYKVHLGVTHFINQMDTFDDFTQDIFEPNFSFFIEALNNHPKLKTLLIELFDKYRAINDPLIKESILEVYNYWNNIDERCQFCDADFKLFRELPDAIRKAAKDLFEYLYNDFTKKSKTLKEYGMLRRQHYDAFFDSNGEVCPFCGIDELDHPEVKTNAYDHYLHISEYPICAINYRNIIPMCDKCNERPSKGTKHILFSNFSSKERRVGYFPYEAIPSKRIQLRIESLFKKEDVRILLEIGGDDPNKIETWKDVFNIEKRYVSSIKSKREFWINNLIVKNRLNRLDNVEGLISEIDDLIRTLNDSFKHCFQHLETAFWEAIKEDEETLELLLIYVNETRQVRYGVLN